MLLHVHFLLELHGWAHWLSIYQLLKPLHCHVAQVLFVQFLLHLCMLHRGIEEESEGKGRKERIAHEVFSILDRITKQLDHEIALEWNRCGQDGPTAHVAQLVVLELASILLECE